jgi:hypothetical protein
MVYVMLLIDLFALWALTSVVHLWKVKFSISVFPQ